MIFVVIALLGFGVIIVAGIVSVVAQPEFGPRALRPRPGAWRSRSHVSHEALPSHCLMVAPDVSRVIANPGAEPGASLGALGWLPQTAGHVIERSGGDRMRSAPSIQGSR